MRASRFVQQLHSVKMLGWQLSDFLGLSIKITGWLSQMQTVHLHRTVSQANNYLQLSMDKEDGITRTNQDQSEFIILVFKSFIRRTIQLSTYLPA